MALCGDPTITIVNDDGSTLSFLTANFNSVSGVITIALPDVSNAVKGNYNLKAVFSLPGEFSFMLGLSLQVQDICDTSYFANAPTLTPDNQIYYAGQGDLVVTATYQNDQISLTTNNVCGNY